MDAARQAFVGRTCSYLAQFVLIVVLPLVLPPEQFTQYNLIMPLVMLGSSVIYGWLNGAAFRWVHRLASDESENLGSSIFYYYVVLLLASTAAFVIMSSFGYLVEGLIPLVIFSTSVKDLFLKLSNASEDYRRFAMANVFYMAGKFVFLGLLYVFGITNIYAILMLFMASELIFLAPFFRRKHRYDRPDPGKILVNLREMFGYGGPLIGASIAVWVVSVSDRYLLDMFTDTITVANYILIYQFAANSITVPLTFFITIYFPKLIRIERESGLNAALQYNSVVFRKYCIYAPVYALAVGIALYTALREFYKEYQIDASLIAVMMAAQIVCGATHFFNKKYELDNRTHLIAIAVCVSAIVDVMSNLVLIPKLDVMGAAISGLLAYGSLVLVTANMDRLVTRGRLLRTRNAL